MGLLASIFLLILHFGVSYSVKPETSGSLLFVTRDVLADTEIELNATKEVQVYYLYIVYSTVLGNAGTRLKVCSLQELV